MAGGMLAVSAMVNEKKLTRNPIIWEGSCVEIFGSMPGRNPANTDVYGGHYPNSQAKDSAAASRRCPRCCLPPDQGEGDTGTGHQCA